MVQTQGNLGEEAAVHTIRDCDDIENQEPDPSVPAHTSVSDGDRSSEDSDEGRDPLARHTEREAEVAVAKGHDLARVNILDYNVKRLAEHIR